MRLWARKLVVGCALLLTLALAHATAAMAEPVLPPGFQDTELELEGFIAGKGLEYPTAMRFAPDGELFVAQKTGEVLRYESINDKTPTTFADIRTNVFDLGDRGILGLALDPKFEEGQPYVYVLYTYDHILGDPAPPPKWGEPNRGGDECSKEEMDGADDCLVSGRLARFKDEGGKAGPEEALVEGWCQQFSSHSVGDLEFGPEGALYASGGEGANFVSPDYGQFGTKVPNPCGDPPAGKGGKEEPPTAMGGSLRSQNPQLLSGKVIRVNPATGEGLKGNPLFASSNANERRLVGEGFRNPFRFAIDPATHQVYVGNVGWGEVEEIDRFTPPLEGIPGQLYNSGWPCYEGDEKNGGFAVLELNACEALYDTPGSTSPPFFSYEHGKGVTPEDTCPTEDGSAISGLDFYEGEAFPAAYKGALFFSDPVRRCIYVMFPGEDGEPDPSTTVPFLTNGGLYAGIDVQEGPEGDLYYVKLEGGISGAGSIHRIAYSSGNQPPVARLKVVGDVWGPQNEEFEFSAVESSDQDPEDAGNLAYSWDLNGDGKFEDAPDEATVRKAFNDAKNHIVSVKVTDPHGAGSIARVTVYPGDTPPKPVITEPAESLKWSVGDTIHFKGSATDAQELGGLVPEKGLSWKSLLFHCPFSELSCHTHPLREAFGKSEGDLIAPEHDYPTQIEFILTATDARGLTATATRYIQPFPVKLKLESQPSGLSLTAGALTEPAPFMLTAVRDSNITLAAPKTTSLEATTYAFQSWSDAGKRVHSVLARCSATYTAFYEVGTTPNESGTTQTEPSCEEPEEEHSGGPKEGERPKPPVAVHPNTKLKKHPSKHSKSRKAKFTFSSTEPHSRFRCKLDRGKFRACSSPKAYVNLKPGKHVFRVYAIGPDGLADKTPAKFVWNIERP